MDLAQVGLGGHLAARIAVLPAQGQCALIGNERRRRIGLRLDLANRVQRHAHGAPVAQSLANGERLPVRLERRRVVLHLEVDEADVLVRVRLARLEAEFDLEGQALLVMGQGLVVLAHVAVHVAQVVVGIGEPFLVADLLANGERLQVSFQRVGITRGVGLDQA